MKTENEQDRSLAWAVFCVVIVGCLFPLALLAEFLLKGIYACSNWLAEK